MAKFIKYDAATISYAEILAPGIDKRAPDLPVRALTSGMKFDETRQAILKVTGGRTKFKRADAATYLRCAAIILKAERGSNVKQRMDSQGLSKGYKTPAEINAAAKAFWAERK